MSKSKRPPRRSRVPVSSIQSSTPTTPEAVESATKPAVWLEPLRSADERGPHPLAEVLTKVPASPTLDELLPPNATAEQRAILEAAKAVEPLLKKPAIRRLLGAMVALRQAYAVAYREMQMCLATEKELPSLTEDTLVMAAVNEAGKPFNEHTLMQGLVDTVFPWIAEVIDRHNEADRLAAAQDEQIAIQERRATPLPIGFKHSALLDDVILGRDKPLVLVGWAPAVYWLLRAALRQVMKSGRPAFTAIHLTARPWEHVANGRTAEVGVGSWVGCCNTKTSLRETLTRCIMHRLNCDLVDLLVCDDLTKCFNTSYVGRPAAANAGDANKVLWQWCAEAGCAAIAGIPLLTKDAPDLTSSEYFQLRTFAHLRSLTVTDVGENLPPDHVRITLGDSVAVFDVPKQKLAPYDTSPLIVPQAGRIIPSGDTST